MLNRIKEEYFLNSRDSFVKLFLRSIVQDDFKELVSTQALHHKASNWTESLAYLLSYLKDGKTLNMQVLVRELGDELIKKKDVNQAIICYIVS